MIERDTNNDGFYSEHSEAYNTGTGDDYGAGDGAGAAEGQGFATDGTGSGRYPIPACGENDATGWEQFSEDPLSSMGNGHAEGAGDDRQRGTGSGTADGEGDMDSSGSSREE